MLKFVGDAAQAAGFGSRGLGALSNYLYYFGGALS